MRLGCRPLPRSAHSATLCREIAWKSSDLTRVSEFVISRSRCSSFDSISSTVAQAHSDYRFQHPMIGQVAWMLVSRQAAPIDREEAQQTSS